MGTHAAGTPVRRTLASSGSLTSPALPTSPASAESLASSVPPAPLVSFVLTAALGLGLAAPAAAATTEEKRAAFTAAHAAAERGDWSVAESRRDVLDDYVLWPDLRATWLRRHLDDRAAVRSFLARYGDLRPARVLRYRYAKHLASLGETTEFLAIYEEHYSRSGDALLDCRAADALIAAGRTGPALELARRLWLVGRSQVDECDPVFSWMRKAGHLTPGLVRQRYDLALGARDISLLQYLSRSLDDQARDAASRWQRARQDAAAFLRAAARAGNDGRSDEESRAQLVWATQRLAVRDPAAAFRAWNRLPNELPFTRDETRAVEREIALWAARRRSADFVADLDPAAVDDEVRQWRIRAALEDERWQDVVDIYGEMSAGARDEETWRYWQAVALDESGRSARAMLIFSSLAKSRSYYGFLAADRLGLDYAIEEDPVLPQEDVLAELGKLPALVRARELYIVGLDGPARAEWDEALRDLDATTRAQAAVLAMRWGWASRAIAMAARAGRYDNIELRYPLAHREEFERAAASAGISESWALGVARSESIFMRDVRSSAGAIGLMQLLPSTGRHTAKQIRLPYRGLDTLVDPESNIRLGTAYLAQMYERFGRHSALATAAYNAGPMRVEQWLPRREAQDARVWVETIPFRETRNYVRRVLTAQVIFEWRLNGAAPRISEKLTKISPPSRSVRTASSE